MQGDLHKNIERLCQRCDFLHNENKQLREKYHHADKERQMLKKENACLQQRAMTAKQALKSLLGHLPES